MIKTKFIFKPISYLIVVALMFNIFAISDINLISAETVNITYDYGDSDNPAFNDRGYLIPANGVVTLPQNDRILNLMWNNHGNIYKPGAKVEVKNLIKDSDEGYSFTAYYGMAKINYENYSEGFVFAANSVMDGSIEASVTSLDGNKCIVVNDRARDGNAVLFDYNSKGEKSYVYYNLGEEYVVSLKYKNICTPEDVWNSISVGFGVAKNNKWEATIGKNNGLVAGKSNIVPANEWTTWTATVTAPDTYAWDMAGNLNQGTITPTYATSNLCRHMAIGFAGLEKTEYLYIDEIEIRPSKMKADFNDNIVTYDYGDSSNPAFNDGGKLSVISGKVTLPDNSSIINLKWKNGNSIYEPGDKVDISCIAAESDGTYRFSAHYGVARIDYRNYSDDFVFAANAVMEGSTEAGVTTLNGNKCAYAANRFDEGNIVLFDYNSSGLKTYVCYNLGATYTVTLRYKIIGDENNTLAVGFGIANNKKWEATLGKNNGKVDGRTLLKKSEIWQTLTMQVTAPDTYAWDNTKYANNISNYNPNYATDGLSRHLSIVFSGLRSGESVYIDDVVFEPCAKDSGTYTIDYNSEGYSPCEVSFMIGQKVDLTNLGTPKRKNHIFVGWKHSRSEDIINDNFYFPQNKDVLTALWLPNTKSGDANNDLNINILDLIRIKRIASEHESYANTDVLRADIDANGVTEAEDILTIKKILLGFDYGDTICRINGIAINNYYVSVKDTANVFLKEAIDNFLKEFGLSLAKGNVSDCEIVIDTTGNGVEDEKLIYVSGDKLVISSFDASEIVRGLNMLVKYKHLSEKEQLPFAFNKTYSENVNSIDNTDYVLKFSDEFDTNFKKDVWVDTICSDDSGEGVYIQNGSALLTAERNADGTFLNHCISTENTMKFLYGYIEVKAKFAKHPATSMIWFSADKSPITKNGAEVDFVENINKSIADNTTEFYSNIHSWTVGSSQSHSLDRYSNVKQDATYKTSPSVSLANDYHVYGLQWTQNEYVFYVDGVEHFRYNIQNGCLSENGNNADTFRQPMFLILNARMEAEGKYGPAWAQGDPSTTICYIDYVRLYQRKSDKGFLIN